jgi:hypothetical protein
MPTTEDKIHALEIAFVEMAIMLSERETQGQVNRPALASVIKAEARKAGWGVETAALALAVRIS